jgi:hypothetical protein
MHGEHEGSGLELSTSGCLLMHDFAAGGVVNTQVSDNLCQSISVHEVGFTHQPISYRFLVELPHG